MRYRITQAMLDTAARFVSESIVGHEHSYAMGGFFVNGYDNLVYSEPGETSEWTVLHAETKRDLHGKLTAMLEGFSRKRKHDKAVFVPVIAELWCESHNAERFMGGMTDSYQYRKEREEAARNAGDAGGRLAATMLTLRRIYGEKEVDYWYSDAMAKRGCLQDAK